MPVGAGIVLLLAMPPSGMSATRQNAAADAVVRYGLALGIDPDPDDPEGAHPSPGAARSWERADVFGWLSSQVEDASDQIGKPPEALRGYLADHEDEIRSLSAALQRDAPDWGEPPKEHREHLEKQFALTVRLARLFLATALVDDFDGNFIESGQALEASWSLLLPMAEREQLVEQILATAIEKLQAGVLRKIRRPSLSWQGRLSSGGPWKHMLAALRSATARMNSLAGSLDPDPYDRVYLSVKSALDEQLERHSPCQLAEATDEEIDESVNEAVAMGSSEEVREGGSILVSILVPNQLSAARRAARTEIDREMTLKVLQLRFEKDASPNGRWPDRLLDSTSAACPAVEYAYRADRSGVELRFEGTIDPPTSVPVVPLTFHGRQPEATFTLTATPRPAVLTPPPRGGMIPNP